VSAEGAEKKLAALSAKCAELEAAVATLDATRAAPAAAPAASASSSGVALSASTQTSLLASLELLRSQVAAETAEREALQTQVGKLKYRCAHLVRMLEEEEAKVAKLTDNKA